MQTQVRKASISPVKFAFTFCLSSLGIWLILAEMLVPSLLSDAYQGAGLRPLNRFFASRAVKKPLEYYLKLWTDFEFAIIISGMAYIILIRCIQKSRLTIPIQIASLFTGALFLLLTVLFGPRQDYVAHLQIWKEVITGHDPWWIQPESGIILNAYGPLFNLFAIPAAINPMAPKIIFACIYLLFCIRILEFYLEQNPLQSRPVWLLFAWLFNPAIWLEIVFYGHFDVLMAILILASVHLCVKQNDYMSGICIGAGFLLKFLPVGILPFFVITGLDPLKWRWRTLVAALLLMISGMLGSWLIWGSSTFRPLVFASERGSSLISIWRYLRGIHSPLTLMTGHPINLDRWAMPVMLGMLFWVFIITLKRRSEISHTTFLVLLTVLIFYKVGFLQYQMVLFMILPYWFARNTEQIQSSRPIQMATIVYFIWIVSFDLFDNAVGGIIGQGRSFGWVEEWAGLPTFLIGMTLWTVLILMLRNNKLFKNTF
jgi:hypothetical protein